MALIEKSIPVKLKVPLSFFIIGLWQLHINVAKKQYEMWKFRDNEVFYITNSSPSKL